MDERDLELAAWVDMAFSEAFIDSPLFGKEKLTKSNPSAIWNVNAGNPSLVQHKRYFNGTGRPVDVVEQKIVRMTIPPTKYIPPEYHGKFVIEVTYQVDDDVFFQFDTPSSDTTDYEIKVMNQLQRQHSTRVGKLGYDEPEGRHYREIAYILKKEDLGKAGNAIYLDILDTLVGFSANSPKETIIIHPRHPSVIAKTESEATRLKNNANGVGVNYQLIDNEQTLGKKWLNINDEVFCIVPTIDIKRKSGLYLTVKGKHVHYDDENLIREESYCFIPTEKLNGLGFLFDSSHAAKHYGDRLSVLTNEAKIKAEEFKKLKAEAEIVALREKAEAEALERERKVVEEARKREEELSRKIEELTIKTAKERAEAEAAARKSLEEERRAILEQQSVERKIEMEKYKADLERQRVEIERQTAERKAEWDRQKAELERQAAERKAEFDKQKAQLEKEAAERKEKEETRRHYQEIRSMDRKDFSDALKWIPAMAGGIIVIAKGISWLMDLKQAQT